MTTTRTAIHDRNDSPRKQAATLLRQAHRRLDAGLDASDSCGWAMAVLPDSRSAQGLMIDALLRSGQCEQANTLAVTLLRQRPGDWRLCRRRAQALLALDRLDEAKTAIDAALQQRPNHRHTLLLAAEIAARCGDESTALNSLQIADAHHPRDEVIAHRLIHALIRSSRADDAAAVLEQMPDPAPELQACVFRAQGRLLDARLVLEDAAYYELDEDRRIRLQQDLIDVLHEARDWPSLRAWRAQEDLPPAIAQRLAETCLECGAFAEGAALLNGASAALPDRPHVVIAAKAAAGRGEEALRMLATPRLAQQSVEPSVRLGPWLKSLLGMIVAEQSSASASDARRAGADPSLNVLSSLLPQAIETFEAAQHDHADDERAAMWQAMHRACEDAMAVNQAPAGERHAQPSSLAHGADTSAIRKAA